MTPKKTKSGKYHVTAYVGKINGKAVYKSITADTKRECILKATEYINHAPVSSSDLTVAEVVEKYIYSKENILSPSTINGYMRLQRYYEPIAAIRVRDLDQYTYQSFINSLDLSPKSVRNIYGLLKVSLSMFSDRVYKIALPEKKPQKRTVPTQEDLKRLIVSADPELRKAIILGSCSLRRGEVAALKYEDIQGSSLFVHADIVKNHYGQYVYKDTTKTSASMRRVEVSDAVIEALGRGEGYIVKLRNPDAITKRFTRLRDSLDIDVSFHSLRRYYASISHALGIPSEYVMKQGGWADEKTMIKSYRHTLEDREKIYAAQISNELSKLL